MDGTVTVPGRMRIDVTYMNSPEMSVTKPIAVTRKLCYREDDRAMRPNKQT